MKELLIRSASGIIYALVMLLSIIVHPLLFLPVFLFILILGMTEFYQMAVFQEGKPLIAPGITAGVLTFLSLFLHEYVLSDDRILLIIPGIWLILILVPMFRTKEHSVVSAASTFLGLVYVSLPLSTFILLAFHPYHEGFDYQVILLLFVILWLNDTGAYLTGKLLGKHKMFPKISPKKSWEGFTGGLIFSFLAIWILRPLFPDIPTFDLWVLCPVIVIFGTLGDFVESGWKRASGLKDSGKLMPGHGGILDRFDSLILAAPAAYITIKLLT